MSDLGNSLYRKVYSKVKRPVNTPFAMVQSGTFVYPLYGVQYFLSHPDLWPFYLSIFVPQMLVMMLVYVLMYVLFYPAVAFISILIYGPFGLVSAWFIILQQSGFVSVLMVRSILMPQIEKIAFDAVLSREFTDDLVLMGKLRRIVVVPFIVKFVRQIILVPSMFRLPILLLKVMMIFALNMIPFIGPILVVLFQAPSKGLHAHSRYYSLKGYDQRQIRAIYRENTGAYMGFGLMALLLEMIPLLSIFFMFTNTIGGALWAISIEAKNEKSKLFV